MYAFSLPCLDCIMRWIDLLLVGGVFQTSRIMRWINLFDVTLDGFQST
jgi:hypothetical protein